MDSAPSLSDKLRDALQMARGLSAAVEALRGAAGLSYDDWYRLDELSAQAVIKLVDLLDDGSGGNHA